MDRENPSYGQEFVLLYLMVYKMTCHLTTLFVLSWSKLEILDFDNLSIYVVGIASNSTTIYQDLSNLLELDKRNITVDL